mgnify:CR=1 FL=1
MKREFTCIVCPNGCRLHTEVENGAVTSVTGNRCPKGARFCRKGCTAPTRSLVHHGKNAGGRRTGIAGAAQRENCPRNAC